MQVAPNDADAIDLLKLVGCVLADRVVWTNRGARAALRWKERKVKSSLWAEPTSTPAERAESPESSGAKPTTRWEKVGCRPQDNRAAQWTVMGALEMAADDPDGPEVIRALDLLMEACGGWSVSRVEDVFHHTWILWMLAAAVVREQGVPCLDDVAPESGEVDLTRKQSREETYGPETLRSTG